MILLNAIGKQGPLKPKNSKVYMIEHPCGRGLGAFIGDSVIAANIFLPLNKGSMKLVIWGWGLGMGVGEGK